MPLLFERLLENTGGSLYGRGTIKAPHWRFSPGVPHRRSHHPECFAFARPAIWSDTRGTPEQINLRRLVHPN